MTVFITTYDPVTGEILMPMTVSTITDDVLEPTGRYVDGLHNPYTEYIVGGGAVPRPANPTNVTGTTLFNIPLPATLRITDGSNKEVTVAVTDTTMELEFPQSGSYTVTVQSFPHVDAVFTFNTP